MKYMFVKLELEILFNDILWNIIIEDGIKLVTIRYQ